MLPAQQNCPFGDAGARINGDGCANSDVGGINVLVVINVLMVMALMN